MKTHPKDIWAKFPKTSRSALRKRLDTVFSKFIRLRDRLNSSPIATLPFNAQHAIKS